MFILHTAVKDLRRMLRDPFALLIWMGIPIMIGLMLKLAFGGEDGQGPQAEVLIVDQDDSLLSGLLLGALDQGGDMPFVAEKVELEEGRARIEDGDGTALIVIPEGFADSILYEEPAVIELVTNPAQRILPGMVEESLSLLVEAVFYLHQVFGDVIADMTTAGWNLDSPSNEEVARISIAINDIMDRVSTLAFPPVIELVTELEADEDEPSQGFGELFFPSMLFMTIFFLASGVSEDIWVEKQMGTLRRAVSTPNRVGTFLAGKLLSSTVLITAIASLAFLVARFAFRLELHNPPLAILWTAVSGLLFLLLLIPLQLFASSQRTGSIISNMVMMPLLMIGGCFFPFEAMPEWMAAIGTKTPNGWAMQQLKAILGGRVVPTELITAVALLAVVCSLLFLFSARRMSGAFARS